MPKYNKVVHLTGVGYEYTQSDSTAGYTITTYYLDGREHKTDGVAMHYQYGDNDSRPDEGYYYLNGSQVYGAALDLLKEIMVCSLPELPKYINEPFLAPVLKERLNV